MPHAAQDAATGGAGHTGRRPGLLLLTVPVAIIAITLPSGGRCARLNPAAVLRSE
jgi:hypothetical protein